MATTTTTKLQNFIDGEWADAGDGATEEVLNPATATPMAEAPLSSEADVDRAVEAAARAFETWSVTIPGERARALLRLADAIEANADELADLESQNAGKPRQAFLEDEIPPMADQLRFFAGAARCMDGRASGEYLEGLHLDHPPRARGRRGADHPLELPDDDGDLEDRPGACHRQHRGAQAGRDHAGLHAQARGARRGHPAARTCSTWSPGTGSRPAPRS